MRKKIPKNLQGILWSKPVKTLDLNEDKHYIIHQVLQYGDMPQIKWILKTYSLPTVRKVFNTQPAKIYDPASFNFVKNFILKSQKKLNAKDYFKNTLRHPRS